MSLWVFYIDELRGFWKSKVMIVLWVGLPLLSFIFHFTQPDTEGIPLAILVGLLVSSISGTLSSVMLSSSIVNEKNRHVYELFLIRPIRRWHLLIAKFLAVYTCLMGAVFISLGVGFIFDSVNLNLPLSQIWNAVLDSLMISLAAMALACAAGILIGVLAGSVILAAILAVYIGNQLSMAAILPAIFIPTIDPIWFSIIIGGSGACIILFIACVIFQKKSF